MTATKGLAALRCALVALLLGAAPAMAAGQNGQGGNNNNQGGNNNNQGGSAPEFDPAVAGVVGAILAGGGLMLARRRRR